MSKVFEIAFQLGGTITNEMRNAFREAGNMMDDMQGSVSSANKAFKVVGAAGAAAVGAIATGLASAVKAADEYSSAMNQIQASTGASTEEMAELKEISKNLYNQNLGEDFNDLAEAIGQARQVTELQGKDLEVATANAIAYRDVFGEEVSQSIKATDTMMKNFGITSEQAYNLMAQGAQNGLNKSDELIDSANEYAPYFSQLGFSANDMFDTFSTGLQNGAFNLDKVGDAVKEFNIRAKDGSKTTMEAYADLGLEGDKLTQVFAEGGPAAQKAFSEVVNAIAAVKDPAEQNALAVSLFGTQAEDLEINVIKSLGNVKSQFDMTKDTMESIKDVKYDSIGMAIQGIGRQLYTGFVIPIGEALLPAFQKFSSYLSGAIPKITSFVKDKFSSFKETFKSVGDSMKPFKDGFVSYGNVIRTVVGGLKNVFVTVAPFIRQALGGVVNFVKSVIGQISTFWAQNGTQIAQAVKNVFNIIKTVISFVMPLVLVIIRSVWSSIKGVITGALNVIMGVVKVFAGLFTGDFKKMWQGVKQIFKGAISVIWNVFNLLFYGKIIGGIKALAKMGIGQIKKMWSSIKSYFVDGAKSSWEKVNSMASKIRGGFSKAKKAAVDMAKEMWEGVKKRFNDMVEGAKALPGRIGKGIKSMAGKALDGVVSMGNKMLTGLGKIINGVIDGLNAVGEKLGVNKKISSWTVPKYARGTDGHPGGPAILGDGGGRELFRTPTGQVGLSPATDTMMYLPAGTQVIPHRETAKVLSQTGGAQQIPRYAKGTGVKDALATGADWVKNAGSTAMDWAGAGLTKVKNVAGDLMDFITDPTKVFDWILNKFNVVAPSGVSGWWESLGASAFKSVKDNAINWLSEKISIFQSAQGGGAGFGDYSPYSGDFNKITNNMGVYDYLYDLGKQVVAKFKSQYSGLYISNGKRESSTTKANTVSDHVYGLGLDLARHGVSDMGYYAMAQSLAGHPYLTYAIGSDMWNPGNGSSFKKFPYGGHMNHLHLSAKKPADAKKAGGNAASGSGKVGGSAKAWTDDIKRAYRQIYGGEISSYGLAEVLEQIQTESSGNAKVSQGIKDVNSYNGSGGAKGLLQFVQSTFDNYKVSGYGDIWNGYHQLLALFNIKSWLRAITQYPGSGWIPNGPRVLNGVSSGGGSVKSSPSKKTNTKVNGPTMLGFERGGDVRTNNPILVGENGPEILAGRNGSRVFNTRNTQQVLKNIEDYTNSDTTSSQNNKSVQLNIEYAPVIQAPTNGSVDMQSILQALADDHINFKKMIKKVLSDIERDNINVSFESL